MLISTQTTAAAAPSNAFAAFAAFASLTACVFQAIVPPHFLLQSRRLAVCVILFPGRASLLLQFRLAVRKRALIAVAARPSRLKVHA
jgi:hypothetical protein